MTSQDEVPTTPRDGSSPVAVLRRVLHYVIKESLGAGGMGQVFLAQDERTGRDVALKFLAASLKSDAQARQRFEREAKAAARVAHANVVRIFAVEIFGEEPIIVAEYVPGENLTALVKHQPVELNAAISILRQVAAGLAAAHAKGVIHRDLKPSNIRVTPDHLVVIVDFGLGKIVAVEPDETTQLAITADNTQMGTLSYMSPEHLRGESVSTASDVFSFGIVAYELLTGVRPFDRVTAPATIAAILSDSAPPDVRSLRPAVPEGLAQLINASLEKQPGGRPNADALARLLVGDVTALAVPPSSHAVEPAPARASSLILSSEFPEDAWFSRHQTRAFGYEELSRAAALEVRGAFLPQRHGMNVGELYALAKKVQRESPSYVGRVIDDDRFRPRRGEDDVYATIGFSGGEHWYWALRRSGDIYHASSIARPNEPDKLVLEWVMREFIASVLQIRRIANAMKLADDVELILQASLRNIKDRLLVGNNPKRAFSYHLSMYGYRSVDADAVATVRLPLSAVTDDLRNVVEMVFGDLIAYFNFAQIPSDYYDYALEEMLKHE